MAHVQVGSSITRVLATHPPSTPTCCNKRSSVAFNLVVVESPCSLMPVSRSVRSVLLLSCSSVSVAFTRSKLAAEVVAAAEDLLIETYRAGGQGTERSQDCGLFFVETARAARAVWP